MQELQRTRAKPDEKQKENDEVETKPKMPEHYKKALTLGLLLSLFQQLTGINGIIFFSNEMFTDGEEGNDAERTARYGSLALGAFSFLGSTLSIFALKYFGRVPNLNFNQAVMGLCTLGLGIFSILEVQIVIIGFVLIFVTSFNIGIGTVMWIYTAEILDSRGWALVGVVNMTTIWFFAGLTNILLKAITAPGFYFSLTVIQVISIIFISIWLKETKGKTKEECEKLYMKKET